MVYADQAAKLLHDVLAWTEKQFKSLGFAEKAEELSLNLVSNIQGMRLLTHTFKDPKIAQRQTKSLLAWLETAVTAKKPSVSMAQEKAEAVY